MPEIWHISDYKGTSNLDLKDKFRHIYLVNYLETQHGACSSFVIYKLVVSKPHFKNRATNSIKYSLLFVLSYSVALVPHWD